MTQKQQNNKSFTKIKQIDNNKFSYQKIKDKN